MRKGFLSAAAALLVAAGFGHAQSQPMPNGAASDAGSATHQQPMIMPHPILADGCDVQASDCCTPVCGCPCPVLGPPGRFWVTAEYLLWWTRNDHVPPLVTTGPATFPVGFLGSPGTTVLFGGDLDQGTFSGARFSAGYWFNDCQTCGVQANFFFLGQKSNGTTFNSTTTPVLARPFFNVNSGTQFSEFTAFPGVSTGSIAIENPSRLWGTGINFIKTLCCDCWYRVNMTGGFQYLDLEESVNITETVAVSPTAPFPQAGSTFVASDHFGTRNQFYGGTLGLQTWAWRGPWFVNANGQVGLGETHQTIVITGSQTATTAAGVTTVATGGLLALPSNIGHFNHDSFSVVPQIGINVGRQIGQHVTVFAGYTFLYWSNVVRPGDQIDTALNINQIPNFGVTGAPAPLRPVVPFKETDFWAQGLNLGVGFYW